MTPMKCLVSACWMGLATFGLVSTSQAQTYPSQDIHFICAFPAGGGADALVRYFAEKVRPLTGRNIIVENRPGASGNIAIEYVARSKPDGHTILVHGGSTIAANVHLFKRPPFPEPGKAIQVAATINRQPFMAMVDAKSPYRTLADLTAAMKAKGDKASYGATATTGTVMGELYKVATGITAVEVLYKSAPDTVNDMLSGVLDYSMQDPVFALAQHRQDRMRILGVSTGRRLAAIPELPTMTEQGVPMDLTAWWAAMVPAATPSPVVAQINKWFVQIVSSDETKKFLAGVGGDSLVETPEVAQKRLLDDVAKWGEYIRIAKIQPQG